MLSQEEKDLILTKLSKEQPNRFTLASAVSKRARQLKDGNKPLVKQQGVLMPVIVAMDELSQEKIRITENEVLADEDILLDEINQTVELSDVKSSSVDDNTKEKAKAKKSKTVTK